MKCKTFILLLPTLFILSSIAKSQLPIIDLIDPCEDLKFSTKNILSQKKINEYVHSYSNASGRNEISFFTPENGNSCRPLMLFISGGTFINVGKDRMSGYAEAFARKGYLTASINYRVIKPEQSCSDLGWWQSIQDINAALKYASAINEIYNWAKFNTNKVILVGESAGAIAALTLTYSDGYDMLNYLPSRYLQLGGLDYTVFPPYLNSYYKIIGTVSLSGGMPDIINTPDYRFDETASVLFVHSTNDKAVPYNKAVSSVCDNNNSKTLYLHGPGYLKNKISNSIFPVELITLQGRKHIIPVDEYMDEINLFAYKISLENVSDSTNNYKRDLINITNPNNDRTRNNQVSIYPNPSKGQFKIKIPYREVSNEEEFEDIYYGFDDYIFNPSLFSINQGPQTRLTVIEIRDLTGTLIYTVAKRTSYSGNDILTIKTEASPGIYIIKINTHGEIITRKIIITN